MNFSARENDLPSVVLGHGGVPLVHCEQGVRPDLNDVVLQVDVSDELQCVGLPLVKTWWQQDGLAAVHGEPDVALVHEEDGTIAVLNVSLDRHSTTLGVHVHRVDVVHARSCQEIPPFLVPELEDVRGRHEELFVEHVIKEAATNWIAQVVQNPSPEVCLLTRVRLQQVQVGKILPAVLAHQQVGLPDCSVGRGVLELVAVQVWVVVFIGTRIGQEAFLDLHILRHRWASSSQPPLSLSLSVPELDPSLSF